MGLLDQITHTPTIKPPRIVIHGSPGVGKTTFAADCEGVLFMPIEEGLGTLDVPHLPHPRTLDDVMTALIELEESDHDFRAIAIDSVDKLEPLIWEAVCEDKGKANIEEIGYGKGYTMADGLWQEFFRQLDTLRAKRSMTAIVIAHNTKTMIDDPQIGSYSRYETKLHKRANGLLVEWADVIGFLNHKRVALDKGKSEGRQVRTSMTTGERILYLDDDGSFVAKNRYGLPGKIPIPLEHPYQAFRAEMMKALGITPPTTKKEAA